MMALLSKASRVEKKDGSVHRRGRDVSTLCRVSGRALTVGAYKHD